MNRIGTAPAANQGRPMTFTRQQADVVIKLIFGIDDENLL
jgi:hypothetical protein